MIELSSGEDNKDYIKRIDVGMNLLPNRRVVPTLAIIVATVILGVILGIISFFAGQKDDKSQQETSPALYLLGGMALGFAIAFAITLVILITISC